MSKRVINYPKESETGRRYWRSLGQLENRPEFQQWLEREFPQGAAEFKGGEVSRRNFIQLMGASAALAGLSMAACRRELHLVPFSKGVEWSIPGKALFFATSMPTKRGYQPLVVTTYDGRPTKIEGNPMHPAVKGTTNTWSQSSVLDVYDPDRSRDFLNQGEKSDAGSFEKAIEDIFSKAGDGSGIAFLAERNASPTRERLRSEIEKKYSKITWAEYEPTGGLTSEAATAAFGAGVAAAPQLDKANVIVSVDCDFLSCSEGDIEQVRQFTARRKLTGPDAKMNRLYVAESHYTVTGGMADHRLRVPASRAASFLHQLASDVADKSGADGAALKELVKATTEPGAPFNQDWVKETAADLVANKGQSLVLVGERQSALAQLLGYAINATLGNLNKTLVGRAAAKPAQTIEDLAKAIGGKKVQTLFILGGNPVYNAPADLGWADLQSQVKTVVRLGFYEDETTKSVEHQPRVTWHAPVAHYLEAWGDGLASDGSYTSVQPMILPLYGGWSELDLLGKIAGYAKTDGPEQIQATFKTIAGGSNFTTTWAKFLHDGFLANSQAKPQTLNFNAGAVKDAVAKHGPLPALAEGDFEVVFVADSKVDDGRYANNGWLQELPDPISKLTWDNAAWISPATAKKLGVEDFNGDMETRMIVVTVDKKSLKIPAIIVPGTADNSIIISLGYGRTVVGRVGRGTGDVGTGFNAYPLRTTKTPYVATGATVEVTPDETYEVAITQEHGTLEGRGADLTREANFEQYTKVARAAEGSEERNFFKTRGDDGHIPPNISLYSHPPLSKPLKDGKIQPAAPGEEQVNEVHAWGMNIDLNSCVGCSACMVACQSENNVPIVGKEQVIGNREMHWLRMDRYWASGSAEGGKADVDLSDPEMVSQPMMCQHCENAPCETVCPVNATVHSEDGINIMAYNRCIGTRYCANNCPFKVRRFNFFDYNERDVLGHKKGNPFSGLYKWNLLPGKGMPETLKMQKNPNVTVRMRGVMEKCTFCIQRIQEAKIAAKAHAADSDRPPQVPANAFTTACAQSCPTDAITFGDLNNPESDVAKARKNERGYFLLEFLNINSRVLYMARIRNPNPKMPDATRLGSFMSGEEEAANVIGASNVINA